MQPIADLVEDPLPSTPLDDEDDKMPVPAPVSGPQPGCADGKPDPGGEQDYWTINRETVVRHHRVPRTKLYIPDEKTFPIPVKYVDVTR